MSVFLNQGNGAFAAAVDFNAGEGPYGIVAADLNSDGRIDLAVPTPGPPTYGVTVLLNTCIP